MATALEWGPVSAAFGGVTGRRPTGGYLRAHRRISPLAAEWKPPRFFNRIAYSLPAITYADN